MGGTSSSEKEATPETAQHAVRQAALHSMSPEAASIAIASMSLEKNYSKKNSSSSNSSPSTESIIAAERLISFSNCLRGPPKLPLYLVDPSLAGLTNYGNTCYANSVLQMLFHTPSFRHHIAEVFFENHQQNNNQTTGDEDNNNSSTTNNNNNTTNNDSDAKKWKQSLWFELAALFSKMSHAAEKSALERKNDNNNNSSSSSSSSKNVVEPKDFVYRIRRACPQFNNAEQHDAHEFVLSLLDILFDEEKQFFPSSASSENNNNNKNSQQKVEKKRKTLQTMTGHTITETCCIECDSTSRVKEKLIDWVVALENRSSLRHVAESFGSYELLTGDNKFRCDSCASSVVARRRTLICADPPPKFLLMQLKRYKYHTQNGGQMTKSWDFVPFGNRLRVPVYDTETKQTYSVKYKLCAFVVHHGPFPNAGHYYCIAFHRPTNQWLMLNDHKATVITERERNKFLGHCADVHIESKTPNSATAYLLSLERDDGDDFYSASSSSSSEINNNDNALSSLVKNFPGSAVLFAGNDGRKRNPADDEASADKSFVNLQQLYGGGKPQQSLPKHEHNYKNNMFLRAESPPSPTTQVKQQQIDQLL